MTRRIVAAALARAAHPTRRFIIALGHTIHSFGRRPLYQRTHSAGFVVLFGREDTPGQWS